MKEDTRGVQLLRGDPKKAILKMSVPMIIAMSVQTIYNFVDAIWVSGLGPNALSAVGFFLPFFYALMALSNGIGIGGSAALSRRIGAKDALGADMVANHSIVLGIIVSLIFSIPTVIFSENIFRFLGAGDVTGLAVSYGNVLFGGAIVIFFTNIANSLLRGEGDTKRAMYAIVLGSGLNIVLDPIFIYTFDMGVAGAAWATLLSMSVSAAILFYWLFIRNDAYITIRIRNFKHDLSTSKDILKVGLPFSLQQMSMSIMAFILNGIVVVVAGTDGVAIYATGWRIASLAILPCIGIASAVTAVTGAAYGMRSYENLNTAYLYAIRLGLLMEICVAAFTFFFAPGITALFTQAEESARIASELTNMLRIMCLYYIAIPFGMMSSSMFQGIGKGINSLMVTIWRTLILTSLLSSIFALYMDAGLNGVWWGNVIGNGIGASTAFIWGRMIIGKLRKNAILGDTR